jgi:hypothetical protein
MIRKLVSNHVNLPVLDAGGTSDVALTYSAIKERP